MRHQKKRAGGQSQRSSLSRLRLGSAAVWTILTGCALLLLMSQAAFGSTVTRPTGHLAPLSPAFTASQLHPVAKAGLGTTGGHGMGLEPAPQDLSFTRGMQVPSVSTSETLPSTYDLRSLGRVTSVKDQGAYGTCWAFASLGSLESCLLPGETDDFSEDNMALASGFDMQGGNDPYNDGGNMWMSTAYLARWGGPVFESDEPYGQGYVTAGLSPRKHVQGVDWIPARGSALDNDNLKNAVTQYGGVCVGMYYDPSDASCFNSSTDSYYYGGTPAHNHMVVIVGWDDNYPASNFTNAPPGDGAFIVKNSWGTGWGDNGYFYVSYYDSSFASWEPSAVFDDTVPTSNYSGIYQYDPLGDVDSWGYSDSSGWFANVFNAQGSSTLNAVGFYALSPGTSYTVYTGSSLANLTENTSGTIAYMGYHEVTLSSPVGLASGQQFVVAVEVTSPGAEYPVAVEPHCRLL